MLFVSIAGIIAICAIGYKKIDEMFRDPCDHVIVW